MTDAQTEPCFSSVNSGPLFSRIAGVGAYLPDRVLTSAAIEDELRAGGVTIPAGFIERTTGVQERRVAGPNENASDLAVAAAHRALAQAGLSARDVDILVFAAASQDLMEPATAHLVQAKLGADAAYVFDIKNACNSVLSALDFADSQVRLKRAETVLIVTGEMPSVWTDRRFASRQEFVERFSHLTMGDAGGAIVLTPAADADQGVVAMAAVSRGVDWELGTIRSFGTMRPRDLDPEHATLRSRGAELEARGRQEIPRIARALLEAAAWDPHSVDVVVCHQHSWRIAFEIVELFGGKGDRVMLPLRYAGNAAAANIPLGLVEAQRQERLRPGSRVVLCGGSAGFSAMAMALTW